MQTTTGLHANDYWFGVQTTMGSLSKRLLVRARSTTGLSANDYCSALRCSMASAYALEKYGLRLDTVGLHIILRQSAAPVKKAYLYPEIYRHPYLC